MTRPWSIECEAEGSGQCDGYIYGGEPCACPCHEADLPATIAGVKVWHDDMHGVPNRASDGYWSGFCAWLADSPMSEYNLDDTLSTLMSLYERVGVTK